MSHPLDFRAILRITPFRELPEEESEASTAASTAPLTASKPKRIRRASIASQAAQLWKAAKATGINVAMTVEGDSKVTATPVAAPFIADDINEWDRDLGAYQAQIRQ